MRSARLLVLAAAFLFSTGGTVIKATDWDGFAVASGRAAVAALVLFALMPSWRRFWEPKALLVGTGYGATMVLFVLATKLTTAANAIFLQSTAPLYVLVLAPWLLGERNRRSDYLSAAAIAIGMSLFFVGTEQAVATAPQPGIGNAIACVAAVSWAFTVVGLRWAGRASAGAGAHNRDLAGAAAIAGNVIAFALALPFSFPLPQLTAIDVGLVGYLGVFQVGLAYIFMTRGLRSVPALEVALLLLLEPVLSTGITWWIHGEQPGPFSLAGCGVILIATAARVYSSSGEPGR